MVNFVNLNLRKLRNFSAGLPGRREIIMEIIKVLCQGALPPEPPVPPASRPATPVQADLSAGRWPAAGRPIGRPVGKAGAHAKLGKHRWVIIVLIIVVILRGRVGGREGGKKKDSYGSVGEGAGKGSYASVGERFLISDGICRF